MVMYAIANIAKFERRQTSERISVNFQAKPEEGVGAFQWWFCALLQLKAL
jgi:hypothetical protein